MQSGWYKCLQGNCFVSSLIMNWSLQTAQRTIGSGERNDSVTVTVGIESTADLEAGEWLREEEGVSKELSEVVRWWIRRWR